MNQTAHQFQALVYAMRHEAEGIVSVELRPLPGAAAFPGYEPGAHIDLHLGNGLVRSYSLFDQASPPDSCHPRYRVAVLNDRGSRGGSRWVHEQLRVGKTIGISAPRNHFALEESAGRTVLVAGGIGVTPLLCMLQWLIQLSRPVEMIYCARNRREAAFVEDIERMAAQAGTAVHWHFDDEAGGPPQLQQLLADKGAQTHYYCCGPGPMLNAFEQACASLGYEQVHIERFAAQELPPTATAGRFEVYLEQSGLSVEVPEGKSVLDALLDAGVDCDYSCKDGVCGSCETRVLEGEVEHFDGILTKKERESNQVMMICVSRCKSPRLVLDL